MTLTTAPFYSRVLVSHGGESQNVQYHPETKVAITNSITDPCAFPTVTHRCPQLKGLFESLFFPSCPAVVFNVFHLHPSHDSHTHLHTCSQSSNQLLGWPLSLSSYLIFYCVLYPNACYEHLPAFLNFLLICFGPFYFSVWTDHKLKYRHSTFCIPFTCNSQTHVCPLKCMQTNM